MSINDLTEQLEEFDTIQNIYDDDTLLFHSQLITTLRSIVESNIKQRLSNLPHLQFSLCIANNITIDCILPPSYPSRTAPIFFVRSVASKHSKSSIEDANLLLKSRINQQFEAGNLLLFDILEWIQDNLLSVISVSNFKHNHHTTNIMKIKSFNLQRSFLWFHHIHRKKYKVDKLAKQYKFTGFCVTGKPGVVVIEGSDHNVNEYITELKSWSWKRMIVRHSDIISVEDQTTFEKERRYKEWIFNDIPPHTKGGMKDVYELLKKGNLEQYYKMIVHINTPIDCTMNAEHKKDIKKCKYVNKYKNGVLLKVNIKPNAKCNTIAESNANVLNVTITAKAIDGAANNQLCKYIASVIRCNKSDVTVYSGHKSRKKYLFIENVKLEDVVCKLFFNSN